MSLIRARTVVAVLAGLIAAIAGCGGGGTPQSSSPRPGEAGTSYLVTVSRQLGGTVTSGDGKINCGTAAAATACGPVAYGWSQAVTLMAKPDAGKMFGTWAGDCVGRTKVGLDYVCVLDTTKYGADKYVVPVFGDLGRTQHPNFSDSAVHGPEFLSWVAKKPDTFECTYCHGSSYDGLGIALSCNKCHATPEFPNWRDNCNFCHGAPPGGTHAQSTNCAGCHADTVDANGIIPGGKHMDGGVQATAGGHADGYASPAVHGRDFFADRQACTGCHEALSSCDACHASPAGGSWGGWQTNCTFCHGTRTKEGYPAIANPISAAPPDSIAQRLAEPDAPANRTGAHAAHLLASPVAKAFKCETCHAVPADLAHVSGRSARAAVALSGANQATLPAVLGTYDEATGTCATYCHGPSGSPAWASAAALTCGSCHGAPPATPAHGSVAAGDLKRCAACHSATVKADGTIDVAGGKHLDGVVQGTAVHAAGFSAAAAHGREFLSSLTAGLSSCQSCHGGLSSCATCHSSAANGWASWQSNCTFCHGTRKKTYSAADLALAAPPDAVQQRLDGIAAPTRTGKHAAHLARYACATCHTVPTDLVHVSGASGRAAVALAAVGAIPAGSYDAGAATCTTYCHGATLASGPAAKPVWSTASGAATCSSCHGAPPTTSAHASLAAGDLTTCASCHSGTVNGDGTVKAGGQHLDGTLQASGPHVAGYANPALHGTDFVNSFTAGVSSCQSCHGAAFASCATCHGDGTHQATLGSGDILVFSQANGDHGADWTFAQDCTTCHYQDLRPQHSNNCGFCHGFAKPATGLTWDRSCSQSACHPSGHTRDPGDDHFGEYWNSSQSCERCHDLNTGEWRWPVDCLGCHSPPGMR